MGNKSSSPAYSYDAVCSMLSPDELTALKRKFKELCGNSRANGAAGGKDASTIKFEEYVGALTLFRLGKKEDQLKFIFMLYEPGKSGTLSKPKFEKLLIDANIVLNRDGLTDLETDELYSWLQDLSGLISLLLINIYIQFAGTKEKLSFADFMAYVNQENQPPEYFIPYIQKILEL